MLDTYALTGNPEYVDGELDGEEFSAIVSRMEQRLSVISWQQLKFAASLASEWTFLYEAFPRGYAQKESPKNNRPSDTRRLHQGIGEAESG